MNREELEAFVRKDAKSIKSEKDLRKSMTLTPLILCH